MSMNVGTDYSSSYVTYSNVNAKAAQDDSKSEKTTDKKSAGESGSSVGSGVIYERSGERIDNSTYSINKMNKADRTTIASQLKTAADQRQQQLISLVQKTIGSQAGTYGKANGNIWRTLASGNFTVDDATRAQAQKDIGEDGYWGVKQTSQRLFDFASALAGDDVEKMKEMQAAMEKGFKKAEKAWGGKLPGICSETISAANKLFEDYYKSKETVVE